MRVPSGMRCFSRLNWTAMSGSNPLRVRWPVVQCCTTTVGSEGRCPMPTVQAVLTQRQGDGE